MAELVAPVPLCTARGLLNPAAVGWSREPLHTANLRGGVHLRCRERWTLVTPRFVIELTISVSGYLGSHCVYILDRRSGAETSRSVREPLARTAQLPDRAAVGIARAQARGLSLEFSVTAAGTRLRAGAPGVRVSADVATPVGHECLGVVAPWSAERFEYTLKDVGRPAVGMLVLGDEQHRFGADGTFAVRDHRRGRRIPARSSTWAVGAGRVAGRRLALQLSGPPPAGGAHENALFVDGRLHRIDEGLDWQHDRADSLAPWRIGGRRVGVIFAPAHQRAERTGVEVLAGAAHQSFGVFTGWVVDDSRRRLRVDGLVGWAQEARRPA